jgi:hypothetical protein
MNFQHGCLLRIFLGESDKHHGMALYEWIIEQARERGIAGATAVRGTAGYGAHHRIHTAKVLRLSLDLPIVIEIADTEERIREFVDVIRPALSDGLATLEPIEYCSFIKKDVAQ